MNIKNKIYYHISKKPNPYQNLWEVGNTINLTQKQLNNFSAFYEHYYPYLTIDNTKYSILEACRIIQAHKLYLNPNNTESIIQSMSSIINEMALYLRETIFEEIRTTYFPNLPSRKYCIWVCEREAIPFWQNKLRLGNDYSIYELNLTGIMHKADEKYLKAEILPADQIRSNAFKYWTGTNDLNPLEQEILFEGIVEIKNKYDSYTDII